MRLNCKTYDYLPFYFQRIIVPSRSGKMPSPSKCSCFNLSTFTPPLSTLRSSKEGKYIVFILYELVMRINQAPCTCKNKRAD